ncbi:glycosyltransferase [Luteimicrobium sp. NPDC057192]|uniref:glycosyltransferase n=1 Tax=Luteimicrobium sp. NPDC057192 TaxID=3346042 RepID=UPI00362FE5A5
MMDVLRVLPQLRQHHVETADPAGGDRVTVFLAPSYETTSAAPPRARQVSGRGMLRAVWGSDARVLEIWEPLWMRHLALHAAVVATWKAASLVRRGRQRPVVAHAMENADLTALLGAGRHVPGSVERAAAFFLGRYARWSLSRVVFATPSSRDLYLRLPGAAGVPARLVLDLPTAAPETSDGKGVVFVGLAAEHKGVRDLLRAWPAVEAANASARLVLVGDGPLSAEIVSWCSERPSSRAFRGALPRDEALAEVESAAVLAAPSRPRRRWREQVGLPIREGLRAGRTIVTTNETGLAPWLSEHGHRVVATGDVEALAQALVGALETPLDPDDVRAALPSVDSRVRATAELYEGLVPWPEPRA